MAGWLDGLGAGVSRNSVLWLLSVPHKMLETLLAGRQTTNTIRVSGSTSEATTGQGRGEISNFIASDI